MKKIILCLVLTTLSVSAEDISLCKQGWGEYQRGNYHGAIELFNSCIDQGGLSNATLARTFRNMGIVANGSNQSRKGLGFYRKAIALNPADIWADYVNKGNAHSNLSEFDEAILSYQKAFETKPNFNEAHYNLGLVYDRVGDVDKAITNYKLAYENGLNTSQLMERVNHHGITFVTIDEFIGVSETTQVGQYFPAVEISQVYRMDELSCSGHGGRSFSQHPERQLINSEKSYGFKEYGIEFKLPKLNLKKYYVADILNQTDRKVRDNYLLISDDMVAPVKAAVVVTEFPSNMVDQSHLIDLTKQIEVRNTSKFKLNHVLIRELDSDFGTVLEQIVYNRGPSYCFPTSEFTHSDAKIDTIGISRFIYKNNIMVELALIVEKPKDIPASEFGEYARTEMDHFWSGLSFK